MKTKQNKYRILLKLIITSILCLFLSHSYAQYSQIEIKATQLVLFPKFIKWRNNDAEIRKEFNFGVYNAPVEVSNIIGAMAIEEYKNVSNTPKSFYYGDYEKLKTQIEADNVKVLFIYKVDGGIVELRKILDLVNEIGDILVVGNEILYFCENGGMLNFSPPDMEKRRYQVNIEEAKKAGIDIKTQLRSLAGEPIDTRR